MAEFILFPWQSLVTLISREGTEVPLGTLTVHRTQLLCFALLHAALAAAETGSGSHWAVRHLMDRLCRPCACVPACQQQAPLWVLKELGYYLSDPM